MRDGDKKYDTITCHAAMRTCDEAEERREVELVEGIAERDGKAKDTICAGKDLY